MAGYSYAGLRIPVVADTSGFEATIRKSAAQAARAAGAALETSITKSADRAGNSAAKSVTKFGRDMTRTFTKAGEDAAKAFARTTGTAGTVFEKLLTASMGAAGNAVATLLNKTVIPWASEAAKKTASRVFLDMLPGLRAGVDRYSETIGLLAAGAYRAAKSIQRDLANAFLAVVRAAGTAWTAVQSAAQRAADWVAGAWHAATRSVSAAFSTVLSGIRSLIQREVIAPFQAIRSIMHGTTPSIEQVAAALRGVSTVALGLNRVLSLVTSWIYRTFGDDTLASVDRYIGRVFQAERALLAIGAGARYLARILETQWAASGKSWADMWNAMRSLAAAGAREIQRVITGAWAALSRVAPGVTAGLERAFAMAGAAGVSAARSVSAAWDRIGASRVADGFRLAFGSVLQAAGQAAQMITGVFGRAFSSMAALGQQVAGALGRGFDQVAQIAARAASMAGTAWHGMVRTAQTLFNALASAFEAVGKVIQRIVTAIGNAASKTARVFGKEFSAAASESVSGFMKLAPAFRKSGVEIEHVAEQASATLANGFLDGAEKASKAVLGIGKSVDEVEQKTEKARSTLGDLGSSVAKALGSAATIAGAAMAGLTAKTVSTGVGYNTLNQTARAAFATILGSGEASRQMMDDIARFAKTSPFPREAFIEASQLMISFGIETGKVIPYLGAVQDAVAATAGNAQDLGEITTIMGQISAAGKITGTDLFQLSRRGINAAELIGSAMGKSAATIKDEISGGAFDATVALDALAQGMETRFGGAAANVKRTWAGATDSVKGAMREIGSAIVEPFIAREGGGLAVEWANKLSSLLWTLQPVVEKLMGALIEGLTPLLEKIGPWLDSLTEKIKAVDWEPILAGIKQFAPLILGAGAAFTVGFGGQIAGKIPGIGGLFTNLAGPIKSVGGVLKGMVPDGLMDKLGSMKGVLGGVAAGFGILMAVSPEFRQAVMELVQELAKSLMPVFKSIIAAIKPLIPVFVNLAKTIGGVLADVIRAVVPVLAALVGMLAGALGDMLPMLAEMLVQVAGAFTEILKALLPVIPVAIQFVMEVIKALLPLVPPVLALFKALVGLFMQMLPVIMSLIPPLLDLVKSVFGALKPILPAIVQLVGILAQALVALMPALIALLPPFMQLVQVLLPPLVKIIEVLARVLSVVLTAAVNAMVGRFKTFTDAVGTVVGWVTQLWHWITGNSPGLVPAFKLLASVVGSAVSFVRDLCVSTFRLIVDAVKTVWNTITAAWNFIAALTRSTWEAVTGAVRAAWDWVRKIVSDATDFVRKLMAAVWASILNSTKWTWDAIKNVISSVWDWIKSIVSGALGWLRDRIAQAWEFLRNLTAQAWGKIRNVVHDAWERIKDTAQRAWTWLKDKLAGVWDNIRNTAKTAWEGVVSVIRGAWEGVRKAVGTPVFHVADKILKPLLTGINKVLKVIPGIPEVPTSWIDSIPHYQRGGRIPGGWGGGDTQPALLEPGEWVLTKHQAKAIGYNRLRGLPRYQEGGLVGQNPLAPRLPAWMERAAGRVAGGIEWLWDGFKSVTSLDGLFGLGRKLWDKTTGFLRTGTAEMLRELTSPMRNLVAGYENDPSVIKRFMHALPNQVLDSVIGFIQGKEGMGAGGIVPLAMGYDGHRYVWGGPANPEQGWDCSSFINFLAGTIGLPLPGGFRAPSSQHGPVTTDWLGFGGMQTIGHGAMDAGDIAVNPAHIILVTGKGGQGFAARSTATGTGPQRVTGAYTIRRWPGMTPESAMGAGGPGATEIPGGDAIRRWQPLVNQAARMLGIAHTANAWLTQIKTESGGDPNAVQRVMDVNMRSGNPARGLLQVIPPTFAAYAGPMAGRGITDPLANIYAAMNYAKSRYGARLLSVIGHGHGYASGGVIDEPVAGFGLRSGDAYTFGERGPELVTPLNDADLTRAGRRGGVTVNVYPRPGHDEREIAAAVSRELAWAQAGGTA